VVLLAWLLVLLCGAVVIARTQIGADLSAFLPKSPDLRQRVLIEQLQSGVASRTLMLGIEGGSAEQRATVSRAVGKAMRESRLFDLIQNGDVGDWSEAGTWVFQHRYQLSPGGHAGAASPPRACATRSTRRCRCSARRPAT
jgi:predicted exporter